MEKYRPSNGSEGCDFESWFCDRCVKDRDWRENEDNPCEIHNNALVYDENDEDYPKEWIYDKDGNPTCTAFVDENGQEFDSWTPPPEQKPLPMFRQRASSPARRLS